jgi:cysteine desulfurase
MHPDVFQAMIPWLQTEFGNPSNQHHFAKAPRKAIGEAREKVAGLIGAEDPNEVIFTSSGTEANNLALKGVALAKKERGKHIIVSSIEHFSVLHAARTLERWGFDVTYLPVDRFGLVRPRDVADAITDQTILVSIQLANPEVGTIQPVGEIGEIVHEKGEISFHTDAVAAIGVIDVDVQKLCVDLLTLSGHQFYGPKGTGALFVRRGTRLLPLFDGGIQERGRRAGTENVAGIVGLGRAAEIAKEKRESWSSKVLQLRQRLFSGLKKRIDHLDLNGHPTLRLPGNLNVSVKFVEGESLLILLDMEGIAASSGSACTSQALKSSHVLRAMGVDPVDAQGSLLFSLGRENTEEEIDYCIEKIPPIVDRLREMSPLYKKASVE